MRPEEVRVSVAAARGYGKLFAIFIRVALKPTGTKENIILEIPKTILFEDYKKLLKIVRSNSTTVRRRLVPAILFIVY